MFSILKKQKSEKPSHQPKLRGMPALKQMRSSKREEYLSKKTKNTMPSLSDLEQQSEPSKTPDTEEPKLCEVKPTSYSVDLIITPNYKRSTSPSEVKDINDVNRRVNGVDRLRSGVLTPRGALPEDTETTVDAELDIDYGDSGYKSQNDGVSDVEKKKAKKSRRKANGGKSSATSGLHDIKQLRKASRENVSKSMRALTPKERESIQFLEDVIKIADENDSVDEVFDSESSGNDCYDRETDFSCRKIEEDTDEAIDYGYASVNDISRRYSIESTESVGSIIDLVGNLSTSPSSHTSPVYAVVNKPKGNCETTRQDEILNEDNTQIAEDDMYEDVTVGVDGYCKSSQYENDFVIYPEDVITHLDEVINSFNMQSEDENDGENIESTENTDVRNETRQQHQKSNDTFRVTENKNRKKEKKSYREQGAENTDGQLSVTSYHDKEKKTEKKKERDPEKEKQRKDRKKRKKEEKREAKKEKELMEFADEERLREEDIARHVDTITALTQDMIKTAQKEDSIYAQVNKTKKNSKDINQNIEYDINEVVLDPPSQFNGERIAETINRLVECRLQDEEKDTKNRAELSESLDEDPKFKHTSTPLSSPESHAVAHASLHESSLDVPSKAPSQGLTRRATDCSNYANLITPFFNKYRGNDGPRIKVSPTILQSSSENLKHVTHSQTAGKQIQINPSHSPREERVDDNHRSNDQLPESTMISQNFYRHSPSARGNSRPARPMSLNLEANDKSNLSNGNSITAKPYSSFRKERHDATNNGDIGLKAKPFVITTAKKSIELC